MNSEPSHPRGVSQEAAGTTGAETEQIKTLLMHQVLSSNIGEELTPFSSTELRWPQDPSPEGATLFHVTGAGSIYMELLAAKVLPPLVTPEF